MYTLMVFIHVQYVICVMHMVRQETLDASSVMINDERWQILVVEKKWERCYFAFCNTVEVYHVLLSEIYSPP